MKTAILPLLVWAAALLVGGCSTPASRIQDNPARFATFPPEVQAKVRAGEVAVGFTPEMVEMALGKPDRVASRQSTEGESEVWSYREKGPRFGFGIGVGGGGGHMGGGVAIHSQSDYDEAPRLQVVFRDGKVLAIEKRAR